MSKTIRVRIPPALYDRLQKEAASWHFSLSEAVRAALRRGLGTKEKRERERPRERLEPEE